MYNILKKIQRHLIVFVVMARRLGIPVLMINDWCGFPLDIRHNIFVFGKRQTIHSILFICRNERQVIVIG